MVRSLHTMAVLIAVCGSAAAQSWVPQTSGVDKPLRGISAVDANTAWASGAGGVILKTTDGGATWERTGPAGIADVDFRDIHAIDARTVVVMSAGDGQLSRLYRTKDAGATWTAAKINLDPQGFWDAIAFWDEAHGILLGDPVFDGGDGRFTILTTQDGGASWQTRQGPKANKGEAAFAASGTCLFTRGSRDAWFVTGGPGGGRVFHSEDGGGTWSAAATPIKPASENAGMFSLGFSDARHGVAVGGDYTKPDSTDANLMVTADGRKWTQPAGAAPAGYRSAVVYVPSLDAWIAVGTSGSDLSKDNGASWQPIGPNDGKLGFNAVSFAKDGSGWAVGPSGLIARFQP